LNNCLADIRVSNISEGTSFKYLISKTKQIPAAFTVSLRAGIEDRLSQPTNFKQETVTRSTPKRKSGTNNATNNYIICILLLCNMKNNCPYWESNPRSLALHHWDHC